MKPSMFSLAAVVALLLPAMLVSAGPTELETSRPKRDIFSVILGELGILKETLARRADYKRFYACVQTAGKAVPAASKDLLSRYSFRNLKDCTNMYSEATAALDCYRSTNRNLPEPILAVAKGILDCRTRRH